MTIRRLALAAGAAATLTLSASAGAAQTDAPLVVITETDVGSVSILSGNDIVEIASGLFRPVVVATDPASDRLVVGQAGPPNGPASIISLRPGGERATLAAGLVGIADIAVATDGQVLFVTGTDGIVRHAVGNISTDQVATVDGVAIGLTALADGRLLAVTRAGLGSIVNLATGSVDGVVQLPGTAPGRPVTLSGNEAACVPDAVRGEVYCAPLGDEAGFLVDGLPGAQAASADADGRLVVAQGDVISLVGIPDGDTLRRWALAASDVAVLPSPSSWLGGQPTMAPGPTEQPSDDGDPLWLLLLGTSAGLGAVLLTLYVRWSDPDPRRRAPRQSATADAEEPDGDV